MSRVFSFFMILFFALFSVGPVAAEPAADLGRSPVEMKPADPAPVAVPQRRIKHFRRQRWRLKLEPLMQVGFVWERGVGNGEKNIPSRVGGLLGLTVIPRVSLLYVRTEPGIPQWASAPKSRETAVDILMGNTISIELPIAFAYLAPLSEGLGHGFFFKAGLSLMSETSYRGKWSLPSVVGILAPEIGIRIEKEKGGVYRDGFYGSIGRLALKYRISPKTAFRLRVTPFVQILYERGVISPNRRIGMGVTISAGVVRWER